MLRSLNIRINIIIITAVTAILSLIGAIEVVHIHARLSGKSGEIARECSKRLAQQLAGPIIEDASADIDRYLIDEMQNKHIYAVIVTDDEQNRLAGKIRKKDWSIRDMSTADFLPPLQKEISRITMDNKALGTVTVYLTTRFIENEINGTIRFRVLSIIVLLIVTLIVSSIVISIYILRPIKRLDKLFYYIAEGDFDYPIDMPRPDEIGKLAESLSRMRDMIQKKMTALTEKNEELRESEERFRTLLEYACDDVLVSDFTGRFIDVNRHACESLGYSRQELLQMSVSDIDARYTEPKELETLWYNLRSKEFVTADSVYRRRDGSFFPVALRLGLLEINGNKSVLALARDVTERKKAHLELKESEEKLHEINIELERRVERRTAELTAAIQELESFAYTVSHDLSAPLRHIYESTQRLKSETVDIIETEHIRYMDNIIKSVDKMSALIGDLLRFSKAGRDQLIQIELDMNHIVKKVMNSFEEEIAERQIDWQIDDLPKAFGDYNLIQQVIQNLISNAIKYTSRNTNTVIKIGVFYQDNPKAPIYYVQDNGAGYAEKYANRLFGVFQRLHSLAQFPGNGIGLALVKRIIERHGGDIWAESQEGKGATFFFRLSHIV